jgi:O-antigen ligase
LSLISAFLSVNPKVSLKDSKELLLFIVVPIIFTGFFEKKILTKVNFALLISAYISCLYSFYYFFFKSPRPWVRISGFIGQVMTHAGLLLLFSCMALSMTLLTKTKTRYLWGLGFLFSLVALALTQTRNSWIGLIIAASFILLLYKPKTLILVPLTVGILFLASTKWIKRRALTTFNLQSKSIQQRFEYLKAGIKIIKDYPLFGTGPDTVEKVFQDPKYGLSEEAKKNVHLHNNIIQTAAERGIPTLIAWIVFIILAFISLFKLQKNKDPTIFPFTIAALAAIIGLFIAGLFEYNFADSEITALFLYMITIPFTLARIRDRETPVEAK